MNPEQQGPASAPESTNDSGGAAPTGPTDDPGHLGVPEKAIESEAAVEPLTTAEATVPLSVVPKIGIVVVSYNALSYANKMLASVRRTTGVDYEITVVDNASTVSTRLWWTLQKFAGRINRLALLDRNTFFAEGSNIGVEMSARDVTHYLLLNTDCEVLDPAWLSRLLAVHQEGATGLRLVSSGPWPRADGFCLLVDRDCWEDGLDESYQWWWAVTGFEARLLRQGRSVQAVRKYADVLVHHGGKSGDAFKKAKSARKDKAFIADWFSGHSVAVVERLPPADTGAPVSRTSTVDRLRGRVRRIRRAWGRWRAERA